MGIVPPPTFLFQTVMNEASKLVSESISGDSFCVVEVSSLGKSYIVYPPTIKTIARAVAHFSYVSTREDHTGISAVSEIPQNAHHIAMGLAILIVGKSRFWKIRSRVVYRKLMGMTPSEVRGAMELVIPLLGGEDFFVCATLAKSVAGMVAKQKS